MDDEQDNVDKLMNPESKYEKFKEIKDVEQILKDVKYKVEERWDSSVSDYVTSGLNWALALLYEKWASKSKSSDATSEPVHSFSSGKFDLSEYEKHRNSLDIDHAYVRDKCREISFFSEDFFS